MNRRQSAGLPYQADVLPARLSQRACMPLCVPTYAVSTCGRDKVCHLRARLYPFSSYFSMLTLPSTAPVVANQCRGSDAWSGLAFMKCFVRSTKHAFCSLCMLAVGAHVVCASWASTACMGAQCPRCWAMLPTCCASPTGCTGCVMRPTCRCVSPPVVLLQSAAYAKTARGKEPAC